MVKSKKYIQTSLTLAMILILASLSLSVFPSFLQSSTIEASPIINGGDEEAQWEVLIEVRWKLLQLKEEEKSFDKKIEILSEQEKKIEEELSRINNDIAEVPELTYDDLEDEYVISLLSETKSYNDKKEAAKLVYNNAVTGIQTEYDKEIADIKLQPNEQQSFLLREVEAVFKKRQQSELTNFTDANIELDDKHQGAVDLLLATRDMERNQRLVKNQEIIEPLLREKESIINKKNEIKKEKMSLQDKLNTIQSQITSLENSVSKI